jgi:hypothetical protein
LLRLKPSVGKTTRGGNKVAYIKHHRILVVKKQLEEEERHVVNIACFQRAAQVFPTDI